MLIAATQSLVDAAILLRNLRLQPRAKPTPITGSGPGTEGVGGGGVVVSTIFTLSSNRKGGKLPLVTARPQDSNVNVRLVASGVKALLVNVLHAVNPWLGFVQTEVL